MPPTNESPLVMTIVVTALLFVRLGAALIVMPGWPKKVGLESILEWSRQRLCSESQFDFTDGSENVMNYD